MFTFIWGIMYCFTLLLGSCMKLLYLNRGIYLYLGHYVLFYLTFGQLYEMVLALFGAASFVLPSFGAAVVVQLHGP